MSLRTHYVDELLTNWAAWVVKANRGKLGYAMGGYAERIGTSSRTDDHSPDIDPDVPRLDDLIRKLPSLLFDIVWLHYVVPGGVKTKRGGLSETEYFARVRLAKEVLRNAWDEYCEKKQVASAA